MQAFDPRRNTSSQCDWEDDRQTARFHIRGGIGYVRQKIAGRSTEDRRMEGHLGIQAEHFHLRNKRQRQRGSARTEGLGGATTHERCQWWLRQCRGGEGHDRRRSWVRRRYGAEERAVEASDRPRTESIRSGTPS